ncbi:MAG: bifunctional sulfate adenylyltransferase subunit 1/adenylylsulfate kinase [Candidatus Neomarinimicrobiota bacterium]|nr:MAG: bifunctional sulfate adenylyltransferase subunit 1/adenylylsulfate kinase [Candidatus Neomarinimicrobiota bacterium]
MEDKTNKLSIEEFLALDEEKDLLRLLTAGSVDDGKSTLIGRLLFDSKRLYDDQLSALERDSKRVGHAGEKIDYALLLDGLKAEREQGITIDVAYRYFSTNKRKFIIADTPGHEQYTRNMVTGASTANLAIILVDAEHGVITQTKRHTFLISLLGIKHVVLAVNKMDLVDYKKEVFDDICKKYKSFLTRLNIPDVHFIPMSALNGDNVVNPSENMPWYKGQPILELLETIHVSSDRNFVDMRYPIQYVLRPEHNFRGFSTKVASGILRKGDEVMVLPSRKTSKIKKIVTYDGDLDYAFPPQSVTVTLKDEIDISRGDMLVHPNNQPRIERHFEAMLVWMDEKKMDSKTNFIIKQTTNMTKARIDDIRYKIDVNTMHRSKARQFKLNEIGRVVVTTSKPLFFDAYERNRETGSFILIDPVTHNTSAVGMIIDRVSSEDLPNRIGDADRKKIAEGQSLVTAKEREEKYQQKGQTIWITGLHGSGKTDIAYMLEKRLFDLGHVAVLLDGHNVRSGLSKELDFSSADRAEHLRRVAEVCRLLNEQGIITICTFISPRAATRKQIMEIIGEDRFRLVYMSSDLESSRANRPDLYKLAEDGKLQNLAGVDAPYEIPENPDVILDLENKNIETIIELIQSK